MNVLVACEYSGRVRDAFRAHGHTAYSCDLDAGEGLFHIRGDVLQILDLDWDLLIAHPPCTYLANSGAQYLRDNLDRWKRMVEGVEFFKKFLTAKIPRICVENPVPHRYAMQLIGERYTQIIQPYEYGGLDTKKTCLWLKNLPPLIPTWNRKAELDTYPDFLKYSLNRMPGYKNRGKRRSKTSLGVAAAMAQQWGVL